jgi:histidinol-phosphate/aromatic aminotransferase/cobyric acid decarboxylase-like protein
MLKKRIKLNMNEMSYPPPKEIIEAAQRGLTNLNRCSRNFLLAKTDMSDMVRKLDDIGIQILDLSNQLAPGFIGVSIGTREENDTFIEGYMKIRAACSGAC